MVIVALILLFTTIYFINAYMRERAASEGAMRSLKAERQLHTIAIKLLVRNIPTRAAVGLYCGMITNDYLHDDLSLYNYLAHELGMSEFGRAVPHMIVYESITEALEKDWRKYELEGRHGSTI